MALPRKSCAESKESEQWDDGNEYPVIKVGKFTQPSFYTGKNTLVDTAGRIDKFRTRYAKHKSKSRPSNQKTRPGPGFFICWI